MKKSNRELERIVKGFANHRRLQILELLGKEPELSVQEVSDKLKSEFKNISAHMNKMAISGLLMKRSEGNIVRHKLTNRGKSILQFVRIIE
ncbi:hypothetical protein KKA39_01525 [Patescibacteria group bacterium]|nr:hypothetical protein [Patescibacteria group bacterium]MBU1727972.1 hypothetical protein [Patescibacteria group bacterium]